MEQRLRVVIEVKRGWWRGKWRPPIQCIDLRSEVERERVEKVAKR
jgi:hypothetical protein